MTDSEKIETAIRIIEEFGSIDGAHHKQWVLDQVIQVLLGGEYEDWKEEMRGDWLEEYDEYEYGEWDKGIAP